MPVWRSGQQKSSQACSSITSAKAEGSRLRCGSCWAESSGSTSSAQARATPAATASGNGHRGSGRGCISTSGTVALGVASGVGSFFHSFAKGTFIDVPLAFREGMRDAPRLYGGKVANHGPITDWSSGLVVSGKTFGTGIGKGFAGMVQEPVRGAHENGAVGAVKGMGKGLLGLCTGVSSAAMGVVACPGWVYIRA